MSETFYLRHYSGPQSEMPSAVDNPAAIWTDQSDGTFALTDNSWQGQKGIASDRMAFIDHDQATLSRPRIFASTEDVPLLQYPEGITAWPGFAVTRHTNLQCIDKSSF